MEYNFCGFQNIHCGQVLYLNTSFHTFFLRTYFLKFKEANPRKTSFWCVSQYMTLSAEIETTPTIDRFMNNQHLFTSPLAGKFDRRAHTSRPYSLQQKYTDQKHTL
ncbi:hypothetical protein M758_1G320000 [Ceratodon purpureus]|uniref:Uncharacterized protein n=1 Tax=Ceratodon purpureus TaxID=3225 RepID=A0A8T0JE82_CERPU|nr:hypothetical protein KC19_1G327100 [Ceratodon purpureus]KAG0632324.1 hypothetical protein M758_1G320000 [Ceratodon purpureus]